MPAFTETFHVAGVTPQQCFDYMTDPDKGTEWNGSAKEVRAEGEPGVGRKLITKANFILDFEVTAEVSVYEPGKAYGFGSTSPFPSNFLYTFTEKDGGTEVRAEVDVDPGKFLPGGRLLGGKVKKEIQKDISSLKQRLAAL